VGARARRESGAAVRAQHLDSGARARARASPYYGLEVHMHLQMLASPLRVLSAEEADVVYARARCILSAAPAARPSFT